MSPVDVLPEWAAILISVLVVGGAVVTFLGTVGLVRFTSFYQRVHAPTLGTSLGAILVLLASSLQSSISLERPVVHEVLVLIFIVVTTPVTLMLLARATLYRNRAEGDTSVPVMEITKDVESAREAPDGSG